MQDIGLILLIIIAFAIGFTGLWIGIVYLTSRMGGWADLADEFPATGRIQGTVFKFCSARLRYVVNYSNCLTITVSPSSLHLLPMVFFRIGHSALLIPRRAVLSHDRGFMPFLRSTKLTIKRVDGGTTTITLYGKGLADALDQWLESS